jgi:phosphocarrier protein
MPSDEQTSMRRQTEIVNERGLHARAAASFVKLAEQFNAEIIVSKDGQDVPGTSIMGLLMLAAAKGSNIELRADGPEAVAAVDALAELVAAGFNED